MKLKTFAVHLLYWIPDIHDPIQYIKANFLAILYDKFHLLHHIAVCHDPCQVYRLKHVHFFLKFKSEFSTIALEAVARCFFDRSVLDAIPSVSVPRFLRGAFLTSDHVTEYFTDDLSWFRSSLACDPALQEAIKHV